MAHYIDADRLKEQIQGLINLGYDKLQGNLYQVLNLIDSLQQEQPDCHTVEEWIQHIKNADQLTKDIFSKGPYDVLYDALNHPYQHCYDAIKEFGELCFQTGVNSVKQEQPEVDLEREAVMFCFDNGINITPRDAKEIARHFYALGLNARKEDK